MITIHNLTKIEDKITTNLSEEEVLDKLGFIPNKTIRIVGSWKDLKSDTNFYGFFYKELVILTEKEHTKLMKRMNKWGNRDYQQLTKVKFLESLNE